MGSTGAEGIERSKEPEQKKESEKTRPRLITCLELKSHSPPRN